MILLPRLQSSDVDVICTKINQVLSSPEDALELVAQLELRPHWNLSGGSEMSPTDRREFSHELENIARKYGYPDYPDIRSQQAFDRAACRFLREFPIFDKTGGETRRTACWAGLTCLDLPHIAVWRHFTNGKGLSRDRLHGGARNFLRRLWLRNKALLLSVTEGQDPWALIDELSEDAVVQIIERPSIASDPRLASFIGLAWKKFYHQGVSMEPVMRLATRRIRATSQTRMLTVLDDNSLEQLILDVFDHAISQLE